MTQLSQPTETLVLGCHLGQLRGQQFLFLFDRLKLNPEFGALLQLINSNSKSGSNGRPDDGFLRGDHNDRYGCSLPAWFGVEAQRPGSPTRRFSRLQVVTAASPPAS